MAGIASLQVFLGLWGNPNVDGMVANRTVKVVVSHAVDAPPKSVSAWRIDDTHANPQARWIELGSPKVPDSGQMKDLMVASQVSSEAIDHTTLGGKTVIEVYMPENSAVRLNFE